MKITSLFNVQHEDTISDDEIISRLLSYRNVEDMDTFMNPGSPLNYTLKDFGFNTEIDKAMDIIANLRKTHEPIVVYTDYDADGITGGTILWETLYLLGFNVMPYVPHRQLEGYGFSIKGLDNVKKQFNPKLIISVDHGIAAVDQIAYAKEQGMQVIITDHHTKQPKIPEAAEAIFHIPALSGSGVAYFFAKEVFNRLATEQDKNYRLLKSYFETDYLALASIGTIADLVPLVGPSRSVAKYGLQAFPKVQRCGLRSIMKEAGIEDKPVTPFEIGFVIAPRINAIGRLEHALDALRLLCTTDTERADMLAHLVGDTNKSRQDLVKTAVKQAKLEVESKIVDGELPKIIILTSKEWHEGIIGLIASQLLEAYNRPTIIITQGDGYMKASGRSLPSFHLTDFLGRLKDKLLNYGGHKQAAGFSIKEENVQSFIEAAVAIAQEHIKEEQLEKSIEADVAIPVSKLRLSLAEKLQRFEPFGIGNPRPIFMCQGQIVDMKLMGKKNNHLKLFIKHPDIPCIPLELVAFNKGEDAPLLKRGQTIEVAFNIEVNIWNGRKTLQGKLLHWQEPR